ncbi:MAG: hypothetical protein AAGL24_23760 [Pseudomonadota bacterium]
MGATADETADEAFCEDRLKKANINPKTMLATDYLNHFNEVVMLMDMVAMMPECADEILCWEPRTYQAHFADSNFAEKNLAIAAYERAPRHVRQAFDHTIAELDTVIYSVKALLQTEEAGSERQALAIASILAEELQPLMCRASGIVNGTLVTETELPETQTQDTIDALFN